MSRDALSPLMLEAAQRDDEPTLKALAELREYRGTYLAAVMARAEGAEAQVVALREALSGAGAAFAGIALLADGELRRIVRAEAEKIEAALTALEDQ